MKQKIIAEKIITELQQQVDTEIEQGVSAEIESLVCKYTDSTQ